MKILRDFTPKMWEFGIGISPPYKTETVTFTYTYNWEFYIMIGPYTFTLALDNINEPTHIDDIDM